MTVSELSVRRPVLITMVFVLVCAMAVIFLPQLDVALYPSVAMPVLSVSVSCTDAGPEEVEQQVAKVLENQLGSIEGLESMTTSSSSGSCRITLEFSYETNLDDAYSAVSAKLSSITRQLPSWAGTPSLMRFDMSSNSSTIMSLRINGPYTQEELRTIAEETVANLLLRIDGVAEVSVSGAGSTGYYVEVDPVRISALGLTLSQVSSALSSKNVSGSAGSMEHGDMNYTVSVDHRYTDISQIRDTIITNKNGVDIKVGDVAEVVVEQKQNTNTSYINGDPVVTMSVTNTSDSNSSAVAELITQSMDQINSQLPEGAVVTITRDNTSMISETMNEVYKSAIIGIVLAALVIFLFLRGLRTTLAISISMPISILITMMVMSIAGITVNSMSMSGLILGIGMIVDASICILENSYQYREKGYKPAVAAILGSKRMFNAILASTLTTICVFIPVLIYRTKLGMMGMMFLDLIITICISLLSSLVVAVTLVPALFGSILKVDSRVQKPLKRRFFIVLDRTCSKIENALKALYRKVLDYCLDHKLIIIALMVLLLVFSLGFFSNIGMSLAPSSSSDDSVTMSLSMPNGTVSRVAREEMFRMYNLVVETLPEDSYTSISSRSGSTSARIEIVLPSLSEQKYSASEIRKMLTPILGTNPSAVWTAGSGRGFGGGSSISIEIKGQDTTAVLEAVNSITAIISEHVPEVENISSDVANGAPNVKIVVDQQAAADLGISNQAVLSALNNAVSGITATTLNKISSGTTPKLYVEFEEGSFSSIEDLGSVLINTSGGAVRLDSFISFEYGTSPRSIQRENKARVNHVTASSKEGVSDSQIQASVNKALEDYLLLPDGVTISQRGQMSQFQDYTPILTAIIAMALILVYAVMAAQFESLTDPFIIFMTVPMLLIGVVLIHLIMGQDFSLFSIVGIVALIGVVVNNGIVLVDSINYEVRRKTPIRQACLTVAEQRLRPILMTTLTTVLGMVPMAFFPGSGAEMMQPIALTFVGGMLTGAAMTLVLTPVLYSLINRKREEHYEDPDSLINQLSEYDKMVREGVL